MFNTFNNNGMTMGAMYGQNKVVVPQNTQPLTQAEQNELKKKSPAFTTELTRDELLRSYCTHRNKDGSALTENPDGSGTCTICGETVVFPPSGYTKEEVQEIVMKFKNLLNVIKCQYFDIPPQIVKDFFQIMPYVERVPELYNLAMQNFNSYNRNANIAGTNPVLGTDNYSFWNSFDMFHGAGNGMVMNNGGMMMGNGMGNGMMMNGQQAMQSGMMGNNNGGMMMGNPFFTTGQQQSQVMNTGVMGNNMGQQNMQNQNNNNQQQNNGQQDQNQNNAMATTTTQVSL